MFIVPISQMPSIGSISTPNGATQQNIEGSGSSFGKIFEQAIQHVRETQEVSDQYAYDLAMGNTDDLHNISIASAKASAAMELTVQLTSRAVNAYNEIIRMQI